MRPEIKRVIKNDLKNLSNRLKQGAAAAVGCGAIIASTAAKVIHQEGVPLSGKGLGKFSLLTGLGLGLVWALTPQAKKDPAETVKDVKKSIHPIIVNSFRRIVMEGGFPNDEKSSKPKEEVKSYDRREFTEPKPRGTSSSKHDISGLETGIEGLELEDLESSDYDEIEIEVDDDVPYVISKDGESFSRGQSRELTLVSLEDCPRQSTHGNYHL